MFRVEEPEMGRSVSTFLKDQRTYRAVMDILVFMNELGDEGIQYTKLRENMGVHRIKFILKQLIPQGYLRVDRRMKRIQDRYDRLVQYYVITPQGQNLMEELENKYKEETMKHLYGRVI